MAVAKLILLLFIQQSAAVIYRLNDTEYYRMPPVFHLDEYESCKVEGNGLYCTAYFNTVSDTPSQLLNMMKEYSDHRVTHYNHTLLKWGLCIPRSCQQYANEYTIVDPTATVEACLNDTLWNNYQLKTKVVEGKLYCSTPNETPHYDKLDLAVAALSIALIILNSVGTLYDCLRSSDNKKGNPFLMAFSIRDNWHKLTVPVLEGMEDRIQRFKGLNGIRTITVMLVIAAHSTICYLDLIDNTRDIENTYDKIYYQVLYNGTMIVQTFFIISAFLMSYNTMVYEEKHQMSIAMFPKAVLNRYLRLAPPYLFILALSATWLRHSGSGPAWNAVVSIETQDCRRYWWQHILLINNYVDYSHCMGHTWYIATDIQLQCMALLIFIFIKSTRRRVAALLTVLTAGMLMPAAHTYFQDLDPNIIPYPEAMRNYVVMDPTFNFLYQRGHNNVACFTMGLLLGLLIYYAQKFEIDIEKYRKFRYAYWCLFPMMLCMSISCAVFYRDAAPLPPLVKAIIAALLKPTFGLLICTVITGLVYRFETIYRNILEWGSWAAPSRVAYTAYITHIMIVRMHAGAVTTLSHSSFWNMVFVVISIIIFTFLLSYPLYLLVEAPAVSLGKLLMSAKKKPAATDKSSPTASDIANNNVPDKPKRDIKL